MINSKGSHEPWNKVILQLSSSPHHVRLVFSQDQVSYLTAEYEDAVQRARRLSASREKILTGRGNTANLLTEGDVVIYLHWLICHLHSVQTIHNFLRVKTHTDSDFKSVFTVLQFILIDPHSSY